MTWPTLLCWRRKLPMLVCRTLRRQAIVMALILFSFPAIRIADAQTQTAPPGNLPKLLSKDDAVRIALAYNQNLRAQRLNIDQSKAEEITALLKPNPTFTSLVDTIPIFSPNIIRFNTQIYAESLS